MIRILGRASSINVRKVLWTAREAELPFAHEEEWAGARETQTPQFLDLNPNGLVPVLVSPDGVLWESNSICRYIAAASRRADLLPLDPWRRAQVEKWMDWQATCLNSAWRPAFASLVRPKSHAHSETLAHSIESWNALMLILEQQLRQTGAFVAGETFTLADVVMGLSLHRWLETPISRPETPALLKYRDRLMARPEARPWLTANLP